MKFKIILKTKDEEDLIDLWIRYYSKLVGKKNIIIFDNHSTNPKVLEVYKNHSIDVLKIDIPNDIHFYERNKDFYEDIFANYDWFSVIDTDEFLCAYKNGTFSVEGVFDILQNTQYQALGSIWLSQMHLSDSKEHFKINKVEHNKKFGKVVIKTSHPRVRNTIFCHNSTFKDEKGNCDAYLGSGLVLLHLNRTNPKHRIKNCIEMCLCSSSQSCDDVDKNKMRAEIHEELKNIKITGKPSEKFLQMTPPEGLMNSIHKLREIQEYYTDKYTYIEKYYSLENNYIRSNLINNYVFGNKYKQEPSFIHPTSIYL